MLESIYERCLGRELELQGIEFKTQIALPVQYKGLHMDCGYRLDFLIEDQLVVELKSVEKLLPIHEAQLLTYLRVFEKRTGLLMNFNTVLLKDGIKRMILD